MVDLKKQRPKQQWWMDLRLIARLLAQPGPQPLGDECQEPSI